MNESVKESDGCRGRCLRELAGCRDREGMAACEPGLRRVRFSCPPGRASGWGLRTCSDQLVPAGKAAVGGQLPGEQGAAGEQRAGHLLRDALGSYLWGAECASAVCVCEPHACHFTRYMDLVLSDQVRLSDIHRLRNKKYGSRGDLLLVFSP